jgi:glycosyltransferase involved in cell wall biosynthesis
LRVNHDKFERVQEWLSYTRELAAWCFRNLKNDLRDNNIDGALSWATVMARIYSNECDPLVSQELEHILMSIGSKLPAFDWVRSKPGCERKRCLHVIDQPRPYGGLTAMLTRWISSDTGPHIHSVALVSPSPMAPALSDAVRRSGGEVLIADSDSPMLSRALWLRKQAFSNADYVVLHVDCWNVMVPVAFGVEGGPPVLLNNHAAHVFWLGASVVDLVLNCRGSDLEIEWTSRYRGIPRCTTLPIPLPTPVHDGNRFDTETRRKAREQLGIPGDAVVVLSVGREFKYKPIPNLNFPEAMLSILKSCPNAYFLAAGPTMDQFWAAVNEKVGGRIKLLGLQRDVSTCHAAADVYVESFPFGSTTALLEAGSYGIPCVLAPADCPPPFGTDGISVDYVLTRPTDVRDYVQSVVTLIESPAERERCGRSLATSILKTHTGSGWLKYLDSMLEQVPPVHSVYPAVEPESPPAEVTHYWARFMSYWTDYIGRFEGDPLEYAFGLATQYGLRPRIDRQLFRSCRNARRIRSAGGSPLIFYLVLSLIGPFLPTRFSALLFDKCLTILRANGRLRRIARRLVRLERARDDRTHFLCTDAGSAIPAQRV